MKRFLFIMFALYILLPGYSQVADTQVKSSLIYHICDYVIWEREDSIYSFDIGVLGSLPDITNSLKELSRSKRIHNKPVTVMEAKYRNLSNDFEAIYVGEQYFLVLEEIYKVAKEENILIITSDLENILNTHVNFYIDEQTQNIRFVVNKQNLVLSGFDYKDELLLYGGTVVDVRELYQSTQRLLKKEEAKVIKLDLENRKRDSILSEKNKAIDSLTNNIENSHKILVKLSDSISQQNKFIFRQQKALDQISQQFADAKKEMGYLQKEHQDLLQQIDEKEAQLKYLDEDIMLRENLIAKRDEQIAFKDEQIADKDTIIEARKRALYVFIGLVVSLLIIGLLIFRAYRTKQKLSVILEQEVNKRTIELQSEIERRKQFEDKLIKSERNYRQIFNSSTNAIFIHRMDGSIEDVNAEMLRMYGFEKEDIQALSIADCSSVNDGYTQDLALGYVNQAIEKGKVFFDWLAKRKDGSVFWCEVSLKLASIAGEKKVLAIVTDIDEKKKIAIELENYRLHLEKMVDDRTLELRKVNEELNQTNEELNYVNLNLVEQREELQITIEQLQKTQEQLVESEKMASVGMLSAGVAHEINNPLNFIKGGSAALTEYIKTNLAEHLPNLSVLLEAINEGVKRSSEIVSGLNSFSRRTESMEEKCQIHNILNNCLVMLQNKTKGRIIISKDYAAQDFYVEGNGGKLHQVFLNILNNAIQAIEKVGSIGVVTELAEGNVTVSISDDGSGIKPEYMPRVTEPFFTTKKTGEGTGLGLSITNKIIMEHNGQLKIHSKLDEGTLVRVILPIFHKE